MDGHVASARLLGFDGWDRFQRLPGGRNGAGLAWRGDSAFVVKDYPADGPRGARERSALAALCGATGTPRLLAESEDPPFVVMSYLAGEGSLADLLLGDDAPGAAAALLRWAVALGELHDAGDEVTRAAFATALAERAPGLAPRSLADDFAVAAERYAGLLDELGLPPHPEALDDLRAFPSRLSDPRDEVLSPADTCPDNNVLAAERVHLIDFEHAELRHRAWDVAYLRAPWPSCWCAWTLPDEVVEASVEAYRRTVGGRPTDSRFAADLDLATLGWQAMTPAWFLAGALAGDDPPADTQRPSRRAFVLHRLAAVARAGADTAPAIAAMAADLHATLQHRWGDVSLGLAPAFRDARP